MKLFTIALATLFMKACNIQNYSIYYHDGLLFS